MSTAPVCNARLLDRLLDASHGGEGWIMADSLAKLAGVAHRDLPLELDRLRLAGCVLESHPQQGVRLVATGVGVWRDYLEWRAAGCGDDRMAGRVIEVYQSTGSTQDVVRRMIESRGAAGDGCVATAVAQTAGRGRRGRVWVAPPGRCVTVSRGVAGGGRGAGAGALTRDAPSAMSPEFLTFASAVGVARAAERLLAESRVRKRVGIKWPNDVLIDGKKLAGVLVEVFAWGNAQRAAAIGVGFNVSLTPEDMPADDAPLRARITSLKMLGARVDRLRVLDALTTELDRTLGGEPLESVMADWRARSTLLGQEVRLQHDGRIIAGHVVDIDPYEGLLLRTPDGTLLVLPSATTSVLESTDGGIV